jgi:hypothetical protein
VRIPEQGTIDGIVVEPVPGEDLELRVREADGRPVGDAPVFLRGGGFPPVELEERTDDDGALRFSQLPPGEYDIEIVPWSPGRARVTRRRLSWQAGPGPIEIVLPP